MTWPQYRRRECSFRGWRVRLSRHEAEVLLVLLVRGARPTPFALLCDVLWGDDPGGGPEAARHCVGALLMRLRAKLPGAIAGRKGFGWYLRQSCPREEEEERRPVRTAGRRRPHPPGMPRRTIAVVL